MTGRGAPRRGVKKASERLTCVKPHSLNKSGSPRARSAHHGLGSALADNSPFIALASVMAFPLSGGGPWCSESPSLVLPAPDDGRGAPDAPDDVRGRGPAGPPGSEGAALDRGDPDDRRRAFLRRDAVAGRSLRPANPDGRETARFFMLASCAGAIAQRPRNTAGRFSRNARMPSRLSSVAHRSPKAWVSRAQALSRSRSFPRCTRCLV
ncbi:MAG: hypothetical protein KatS3mg123_3293 [Burkholderiales bacterium]|nr:MAG: hypothetical protein KatS3mg123_3293 [Burkholderiales bacterium]